MTALLKDVGGSFAEESEYSYSSESGKESDASRRPKQRRKVRSGAKIKKRPVIKTELWPHTVANEEDGDDVSSEDISLARFFSCYTFIMKV